jgi:fatty acid desaturase
MAYHTPKLSPEQFDAFGRELDAIRQRILADRGARDADYIRRVVTAQRRIEVAGRGLLFLGFFPPAWLAGTTALTVSKILDNMEIGHNIMHAQYDFMQDPAYHSKKFEWDHASTAKQWLHSHNYLHHTYTNVGGVDRDIGYGVLRMSEDQKWHPYYLFNPLWAALLATFFEYGIAMHDLEVEKVWKGKKPRWEIVRWARDSWAKLSKQLLKDYVVFPVLAGPGAPFVLAGNFIANRARDWWTWGIIFCGHFPDGVQHFSKDYIKNETRGQWYYRQLLGSANIEGGRLFQLMNGNLGYQIEHHLFPDLPAHRYAEISLEVKEICKRYGLPYNSGPFIKQFGTVVRTIFRLSLPARRAKPARNLPLRESGTPLPIAA